ncbi:hypothetical protein [Streptomyces acidicola]|uniref:Uncharacterized protein n=1 Tax=Streptomyces acidicola TaxID=2596892 RepID=A0A5N8WI80_9ACTN|nr:hypothetical protein [Streptomyces acidicola]MPY47131.1 hypothetical protein [Streptomyces acidicola]MPY47270.1 hypothetical protein [Streptomyces acidicola]
MPVQISGMTDQEWEAQNGTLQPSEAQAQGLCWCCTGNGVLYSAFGGNQIKVSCRECSGDGKARS